MKFINGEITSIHSAAFLLGAAGLLSRILGVIRDRLLASEFGAGRELDIYYAAFQLPDLMSAVFLIGAGSAAVLPVFQEYLLRSKGEARELISELSSFFLLSSLVVSGFAFIIVPFFVPLMLPGFSTEDQSITVFLTRVMLLSPIFFGLSSIFSSVVQSFQRFISFALAPVLYNLGIIGGILFLVPSFGLVGLSLGVVFGAFLHLVIQWQTVRGLNFSPHFRRFAYRRMSEGVRRVVRLSFPRFLGTSASQVSSLFLVALGSTLASGSISVFRLAQNLFFLPIGVFAISYTLAVFPKLSGAYTARDGDLFFRELFLGMRMILFWIVPSVTLLIVLRAHVVRAALGAGEFSWEDTRLSAAILAVLALAMFAEALSSLLTRAYYAIESTWVPLAINVGSYLIALIVAFLFANILATSSYVTEVVTSLLRVQDLPRPEVIGLAVGFSLGAILNFLFLYRFLIKTASEAFAVRVSFESAPVLKIVISALVGALVAYAARVSFSETLPLVTFATVLFQGAISGAVGFSAYLLCLWAIGSEDVDSFGKIVRRHLFRVGLFLREWEGGGPMV